MPQRNPVTPENHSFDIVGRQYGTIFGYPDYDIPLGSKVTLLPQRTSEPFANASAGRKGIVIGTKLHHFYRFSKAEYVAQVRFLDELSDWEPHLNRIWWPTSHLFIDVLGDGKEPLAGKDFPLCRKEALDLKWMTRDHTCEGWANPPTCQVWLLLNNDEATQNRVLGFVRMNGTVNPKRLRDFFTRHLSIDPEAYYCDGFPEHIPYRYSINWVELATAVEEKHRDLLRHRAA